ncbi:luciferase family oxidoreductase, group 1 [Haloechinothrix alba]|uniref:Luciferase family oxidoreductase, group 1 n=1 Tax=Haloechinothrix alba TaxID=664784 RepID=A0A238Z4J2_9PSEU|nr:LLM class flavin-dependent oxidoreductase [Haloechinothrix alba]SNR78142.1 luciferase family oxidoreductase, group 1 [Haloechinothrix alba]
MSALQDVPLSVLDLAPITEDGDARAALHNTVDLARRVEDLGYHRYWVAEHHNMPGIASAATAVLVGQIAAATERIRVGSGGVMLPNHTPLVVAEQFGTLEALHPGRIDLGLGRAPGTDPRTAHAVRGGRMVSPEEFPQQLSELVGYFDRDGDRAVNAVTAEGNAPPVWLLGSSDFSARLAGRLGLPFSFAHHFSPKNTVPALRAYREAFQPSSVLDAPYVLLGVSVIGADTDERARTLAVPGLLAQLSLRRGRPIPLPSPRTAAQVELTEQERAYVDKRLEKSIAGSPDTVRARLQDLLSETGADELMVTTMVYDHEDRRHSYDLLAELAR